MTELTKRILFAIIAAPFFLFVIWIGGWYFKVFIILIGLFIQREMVNIFTALGYDPSALFTYAIGLLVMLFFQLPYPLLFGFLLFLYFIASETLSPRTRHIERLPSTLFCGLYAPFALLSFILLRDFGIDIAGFAITVTLILIIWGNDIMAYIGGKNFGKNPLAPAISPGKTREGFLFGFFGGLLGLSAAYFLIPSYPFSYWIVMPLVIITGFFGPVGDLAASRLKRSAGIKDSASILPGHGGFFDRFDALLLASPAVYIYVILVLA